MSPPILMPLAVGAVAVVGTIVIHAMALHVTLAIIRHERRLGRAGVSFSFDVAIVTAVISFAFVAHLLGIALWAVLFLICGEFPEFEAVSNIILTAVKDALRQAVAFEPTLVVVEDARVVGGHLYLRVFAADSEGEALIQELENARAPVERVTSRDASPGGVLVDADEAAPQRHGIRPGSSSTSPARSIRTRNGDPGVK